MSYQLQERDLTPGIKQVIITGAKSSLSKIMLKVLNLQTKGYMFTDYATYDNDKEMRLRFIYTGNVNSDKANAIIEIALACNNEDGLDTLKPTIKLVCKGHADSIYPDKYNAEDHYRCWVFEAYDETTGIIQDVVLIDEGNGYYGYYDYVR